MNYAVVIHWWCDNPNTKPYEDAQNPVVLTAMSVRNKNPNVPIYVIDVSDHKRPKSDWAHFPYKINFKVLPRDTYLQSDFHFSQQLFSLKLLSRVWDVEIAMRDVPEDNILFLDSDVFCLRPLHPFLTVSNDRVEHFYANYNNGVWLYNKKSQTSKLVFDIWKGMICRVFHDDDFRHEVFASNPNYGTFKMQDEIVYRTLVARNPNLIRPLHFTENYLAPWLYLDPPNAMKTIKLLHCLSFITGKDRLNLIMAVKELLFATCTGLDQKDAHLIFGDRKLQPIFSLADLYKNEAKIMELLQYVGTADDQYFTAMIETMKGSNDTIRLSLL